MRILYVSHTASASGAEHSLLVLMRAMCPQAEVHLACPEGELAGAARAAGIPVHTIAATDLSARLHPWHTPRELARALRGAADIRRLSRRLGADLVHANTPRAGILAAGVRGAPLVLHIRDAPPPGRLPALLFGLLSRRAALWIVTSRFLAERVPSARVQVVANAIETARFDPGRFDRGRARRRLGLEPGQPALAMVGQISPHKAQSDAIETLRHLRAAGMDARLLIAGSVKFRSAATRFDNAAYERECHALVRAHGLEDAVSWLGECREVAEVLAAADLLLVPSWYEPFGRVALEAMAMAVPVLGTAVGGVREVVRDGENGLILAPGRPELWARAALTLLADGELRRAMGARARGRALAHFGEAAHARAVAAIYADVRAGNRHRQPIRSASLTAGSDRLPYAGTGASRG